MYLLSFYVPETHLEQVKSALFESGAGQIGNYQSCSWEVKGQGQFQPMEGSDPFIGASGKVEKVMEYKVEMVCDSEQVKMVVEALIRAHPYETPAYHLQSVMTLDDL